MVKVLGSLVRTPLIQRAIDFAMEAHQGQLDDTGADYYDVHLLPVVEALAYFTDDEEVLAAAVLHDTLEDTPTKLSDLTREFGIRVANLVNEVTHEGERKGKGYYYPRLHSREAIMIKFMDRLSNLSRMQTWDEKRRQHYLSHSKFWRSE